MSAAITVRCVSCKHERHVRADDDAKVGPICEKCYSPMVVVRVEVKRKREKKP